MLTLLFSLLTHKLIWRQLCGRSSSADPVFRLRANRRAAVYLDYLVLQGKTLAALHPHYLETLQSWPAVIFP